MDFKQHEATVTSIRKHLDFKTDDSASRVSVSLHPAGVRAFFKLDEVQQLLPVVFKLTKKYSEEVTALMDRVHMMQGHLASDKNRDFEDKIEIQINGLIQEWQNKMTKLGGLPKGLWLLDFDSGDGYFCWKYPERKIQFWHHYQDGFSKRVCVDAHLDRISSRDLE